MSSIPILTWVAGVIERILKYWGGYTLLLLVSFPIRLHNIGMCTGKFVTVVHCDHYYSGFAMTMLIKVGISQEHAYHCDSAFFVSFTNITIDDFYLWYYCCVRDDFSRFYL